ncbi:hypothetical protein [Actinoplanes sp. NPDC051851]|uniref:hypothetical protein n=1 Tax=Actinoplanes sp. NPDC051851 TaxID=3154753 RepID=UPI003436C931
MRDDGGRDAALLSGVVGFIALVFLGVLALILVVPAFVVGFAPDWFSDSAASRRSGLIALAVLLPALAAAVTIGWRRRPDLAHATLWTCARLAVSAVLIGVPVYLISAMLAEHSLIGRGAQATAVAFGLCAVSAAAIVVSVAAIVQMWRRRWRSLALLLVIALIPGTMIWKLGVGEEHPAEQRKECVIIVGGRVCPGDPNTVYG